MGERCRGSGRGRVPWCDRVTVEHVHEWELVVGKRGNRLGVMVQEPVGVVGGAEIERPSVVVCRCAR